MMFRRFSQRRSRLGFTLIEVMLSLLILMILASSIGWTVREMREKSIALRRVSDDLTVGTAVFEALDSAILNCVALDPSSGAAGVRGDGQSIEIVSRGIVADLEGDGASLSGVIRTRLDFDPVSMTLSIGRGSASAPAAMQTVSRRVERLRVRFHDGGGWVDSYDSGSTGRLPVAVEVSAWFVSGLEEAAQPPEGAGTEAGADDESESSDFDFEGFGAPMRDDVEAERDEITRRPDRFRVFTVLGGPAGPEEPEPELELEPEGLPL